MRSSVKRTSTTIGDEDGIMAVILGHMNQFNIQNNDWPLYTERLGQLVLCHKRHQGGQEESRRLLTEIGSKVYELLHSLIAPTLPSGKKYEELVKALEDHLNPNPLVIAVRSTTATSKTERLWLSTWPHFASTPSVAILGTTFNRHCVIGWHAGYEEKWCRGGYCQKKIDATEGLRPCTQFGDSQLSG